MLVCENTTRDCRTIVPSPTYEKHTQFGSFEFCLELEGFLLRLDHQWLSRCDFTVVVDMFSNDMILSHRHMFSFYFKVHFYHHAIKLIQWNFNEPF